MPTSVTTSAISPRLDRLRKNDQSILFTSIIVQIGLGLFFGHLYDTRIYMATGYLAGTFQNPYLAQDLSAVFHSDLFHGFTTMGYPPPWALVLALIYRLTYALVPNLLLYNLAIKVPIIVANILLAYLVRIVLERLGGSAQACRKAWIFMLLNPFVLYASAAWGQFDSIVALLSLLAMVMLSSGKHLSSALLLALAVSLKPIALPLVPVAFIFLATRSIRRALGFTAVLIGAAAVLCVAPFIVFHWDPAIIRQNWHAQFSIGGGMSFMSLFAFRKDWMMFNGDWWTWGMLWVPALAVAAWFLRSGITGLEDLLKKSAALILVFFLTRAWLSEPNILLVLPPVVILTSLGKINRMCLVALWALPLIFGVFNTSVFYLLFPSMPHLMIRTLGLADHFRAARLVARTIIVIPWLMTGWWIVVACLKKEQQQVVAMVPERT